MTIEKCKSILKLAWTKETSFPGWRDRWAPNNPSVGQGAVTALVVNDFLGGKIMRCMTRNGSHYYNLIDDKIVDLTAEQFSKEQLDYSNSEQRSRGYLLSYPDTEARYITLLNRFVELRDTMEGNKNAN